MKFNRRSLAVLIVGAVAALAVACSGGDSDADPTAIAAVATAPAATETAAPEDTAVMALTDVQSAVIRIEAEGTFRDPDFGVQMNAAGSGSGFIIDQSGLAVTNNHVVTGAGLLRVFVGGSSRSLNARLLGVSECSDLAVIDIEGDGFPYLQFYDDTITAGISAFAAGFPLGDPEYTLTRGIVSKARADGESEWASVDYVLEHDAQINPGNSGGPLVTEDALVLGVNYAGSFSSNQSFAISVEELRQAVDRLSTGESVTSIGINGQAMSDGSTLGIWVASVSSGSPADRLGILPGDIITRLEGLQLATDGTMSDYCDVLRTQGSDDVLAVEVLRNDTEQLLEGRLNGGGGLSESFSFARELGTDLSDSDDAVSVYSGFHEVTDDSGRLFVEVPLEWDDLNGTPWFTDEPFAPSITVSADVENFWGQWTEPGLFFGVSEELAELATVEMLLESVSEEFGLDIACEYAGRFDYSDALYTGQYDLYGNCGEEGVLYIFLAALPEDESFLISVQVQLLTQADAEVLDRVLDSFIVLD